MAGKDPVDPNWDKDARCGRIRWRKSETESEWAERSRLYLLEKVRKDALKPKKKSDLEPYLKIDPGAVQTARDVFALDTFDIELVGGSNTDNDALFDLRPRGLFREATDNAAARDGLGVVRAQMGAWVEDTMSLKQSEALCNLQCSTCPRASVLACSAQNLSAADADGFRVDAIEPPQHSYPPRIE